MGSPSFFLRNSRASETRARVKITPRLVSPFLAWGDFHARSSFARSTIPEEKWGTTRSLGRPVNLPYVSTRVLWTPFLYHSIEIKEVGNLRRRLIDHRIPRDTIHPTKGFPKFLCIEWSIFFLVCVDRMFCTGRHTGKENKASKTKRSAFICCTCLKLPNFQLNSTVNNSPFHSFSFWFFSK